MSYFDYGEEEKGKLERQTKGLLPLSRCQNLVRLLLKNLDNSSSYYSCYKDIFLENSTYTLFHFCNSIAICQEKKILSNATDWKNKLASNSMSFLKYSKDMK